MALSPGPYVCTGKDSLRVKSLQTGAPRLSQIRVALNGIPDGILKRTETEHGLEYTGRVA